MFRFADIGRQWVPLDLPQEGGPVRVFLLMDLIPREQLRGRERSLTERTGEGLLLRAGTVTTVDEFLALFDETTAAEDGDVADILDRTHDWRGFGTAEEEIGFSRERFAALLAYDLAFKPIRAALFKASREGIAKNSLPGPAGLPAPVQA